MKGFMLGLLVAGLAFGGYLFWRSVHGTPAAPVVRAPDAAAAAPAPRERKKRRRGAARVTAAAGAPGAASPSGGKAERGPTAPAGRASAPVAEAEPEPEPVKLSAADLKLVSQGDDLSKPDVLRMDLSDDRMTARELTQDDIDAKFRAREDAILDCISRARPDQDAYVPGRVTVKFRIQRGGTVRGVRVEAPAILMKGGLFGCVRGVVGGLRFPASNGSQVVSYPFSLS